ncbi:hypothetical protein JCM6882_004671 [Rhodosporidiobolus microsporus]
MADIATAPHSKPVPHDYDDGHSAHHWDPLTVAHRQLYHSTRQPFLPIYQGSKIANPSALAFFSLAVGLYLLSMVALQVGDLTTLNIVVTVGLGYSGISLLVAGIWEFPSGNPFGAALYCTLSGFFVSLAILLSPWSAVSTAYATTEEFQQAVGQFMFAFFITVFVFLVAAHRSSGGLICALTLIDLTVLFVGCYYYKPENAKLLKAAGGFGIVAAFVCWYAALASLLTPHSSAFRLPVLYDFTRAQRKASA